MATIKHDYISCCGLREIDSLSQDRNPIKSMLTLAEEMYGPLKPKAEKVNPYKPPKGTRWKLDGLWGDEYWMKDGQRIYRYQMEDWDYAHNPDYYDDDDYDSKWRYAVFTQAGKGESYGRKFAALIRKQKLGTVVQATTKTVTNPNSGNVLKAWLWTVNHKNLRKWAQKQADKEQK
jgi:hypothetical protein